MLSIDRINQLEKENAQLKEEIKYLKSQIAKSVSNDLTLISVKEFFKKVLNGEV